MPDREQTRRDSERDPFANDVLGRLIASNQQYQREHGHYIVPLAHRLLAARSALEQAERERDEARELAEMDRNLLDDGRVAFRIEKKARITAEARLAKVPALVEALRIYADYTNWSVRRHADGCREIMFLTVHEPPMKWAEQALAAFEEPGVPS